MTKLVQAENGVKPSLRGSQTSPTSMTESGNVTQAERVVLRTAAQYPPVTVSYTSGDSILCTDIPKRTDACVPGSSQCGWACTAPTNSLQCPLGTSPGIYCPYGHCVITVPYACFAPGSSQPVNQTSVDCLDQPRKDHCTAAGCTYTCNPLKNGIFCKPGQAATASCPDGPCASNPVTFRCT